MGWTRSSDGCACGGGHYCESEVTALRAERDVALAHNRAMLREFDALRAERDALSEALTRLASCEAFGFARSTNDEDRARIDYARAALDRAKP